MRWRSELQWLLAPALSLFVVTTVRLCLYQLHKIAVSGQTKPAVSCWQREFGISPINARHQGCMRHPVQPSHHGPCSHYLSGRLSYSLRGERALQQH